MDNDDIQKGCRNCKHCSKLITEEPCMDCDPRTESPKNHWEAEDENCNERPDGLPENNWGKWIVSKVECPHCCECFNPNNYSKEELNRCPCCGTVMR